MLNKISRSFVQKDFLGWSPRQNGHSLHSLIFMVDKTFFFYFLTSKFFGEEDRVLREWEWMFASNALVNSCKMLDGTQLLVVKKASQKQKKSLKKNVMLSRRTEIWDSGARKRRVLLLCAPQSQSSARCVDINFFFLRRFYFFFSLTRATEFSRKRRNFS